MLHYLWVFLAEFGSIVIYAILFVHLHRQIAVARRIGIHVDALGRVASAQRYMLLYPVVYVCLTLPLAIARMVTSAGHTVANTYLLAAGGLLCSCGWVDVVVYSLTRNVFVPERSRPLNHDGAASRRLTRTRSSRDDSTARTSDTLMGDDDHDGSTCSAAVPLQDLEALTKHNTLSAAPFALPTLSSPISAMTLDSLASTATAPYDSTSKHDSTTKLTAPAAAAVSVSVSAAGADTDDAPDPSASDASLAPLVLDQTTRLLLAATKTTPRTPYISPIPTPHPPTTPNPPGPSHHRTRRPHSGIRHHALNTLALATLHRRNHADTSASPLLPSTPRPNPTTSPTSNPTSTTTHTQRSPPTPPTRPTTRPTTTTKATATTRWSNLHTGLAAANLTPPPPLGAAVRATREVSVTRSPRQAGEYVCEYAGAGVFDGGGCGGAGGRAAAEGGAAGGVVRRGGGGGSRRAWWLAGS